MQKIETTLEDAKAEYEEGKKEAEDEIADGEAKIADAEEELAEIEDPKWYVYDRSNLPEHDGYGENADRMRAIGKVFPVIFFLVAALISLTSMTRMVEEQRTQIGTMKALGYSKMGNRPNISAMHFLRQQGEVSSVYSLGRRYFHSLSYMLMELCISIFLRY